MQPVLGEWHDSEPGSACKSQELLTPVKPGQQSLEQEHVMYSTVSFSGILAFSKKSSQHPQHWNLLDPQEDSMEISSCTAWFLLQANHKTALELFIWCHF